MFKIMSSKKYKEESFKSYTGGYSDGCRATSEQLREASKKESDFLRMQIKDKELEIGTLHNTHDSQKEIIYKLGKENEDKYSRIISIKRQLRVSEKDNQNKQDRIISLTEDIEELNRRMSNLQKFSDDCLEINEAFQLEINQQAIKLNSQSELARQMLVALEELKDAQNNRILLTLKDYEKLYKLASFMIKDNEVVVNE